MKPSETGNAAPLRIGAFGMAPDTANMGVSALCKSFLAALKEALPEAEPVIFDYGKGIRRSTLRVGDDDMPILLCGARGGRRFYRRENLHTMAALARFSLLGQYHPMLRLIDSCAVIVDASAGDSFSDIYGQSRFRSICLPKLIAIRRRRPLLLLPQTYGPYADTRNAHWARDLIMQSDGAWARDDHSLEVMRHLLGEGFDPARHWSGVDMAFGLPARWPEHPDRHDLEAWLNDGSPVVGLNISGLIWHMGDEAPRRFGFRADYRQLVCRALHWLLEHTGMRVLLIPHVLAADGDPESDRDAARAVLAMFNDSGDRLRLAPADLDEQELKGLIGRCHWFCGTRMHSTIAALSSGVPSASVVYSDKARGVFACCGQEDHIIDPRRLDTDAALAGFQHSFHAREEARASLVPALETVREKLTEQNAAIARFARDNASRYERLSSDR
ncbi:polysaccharide pyruvyl transferase family protein [Spiribacter vilamensis]|uniref:Polysaccharide pyruvyl transferase WcaK-like protein n=1 Tax=Spiribacter vilamensis TaxID=531306 RepID=A0A4V2GJ00_9GAMM|nr:polysaccharide pyruvyl transferase family protein [Spiribacter vilamensis]RZU98365.1 polysaccharide pyruvyl transferase WcaK-like protein [Spiribacter vilamensis]